MLDRYREDVAALEARFASPWSRAEIATVAALALGASLIFGLLTPRGLASADAAVYLQQIREGDLSSRPTHVGYYALGWLWAQVAGSGERALNQLSALFGGLSLAWVWLLSSRLARSPVAAWTAVAALSVNSLFVLNSLHAEVYIAESALLLVSLELWLRDRPIVSGLLLAAAALVTPSALFVSPAYALLRPRPRPLLIVASSSAVALASALLPLGGHYLFGQRGLLSGASEHLGWMFAVRKEGMEVVLGSSAGWVLLAAGAVLGLARSWVRPWVAALSVGWVLNFLLGERFGDVPVQLPVYLWAAPLVAVAVAELPARLEGRRLQWGALALGASCAPFLLLLFRDELQALRDAAPAHLAIACIVLILAGVSAALTSEARRGLGRLTTVILLVAASTTAVQAVSVQRDVSSFRRSVTARTSPEPLAVGGWSRGILFEHYRYGRSYTEFWIDQRESNGEDGLRRLEQALDEGREVWLLGPEKEAVVFGGPVVREERGPVTVLRRVPHSSAGP